MMRRLIESKPPINDGGEPHGFSMHTVYDLWYEPMSRRYSAGCRKNFTASQALKHWLESASFYGRHCGGLAFRTSSRLRATLFVYAIWNNEMREKRLGNRPLTISPE